MTGQNFKAPPSDPEAEKGLIGAILLDGEYAAQIIRAVPAEWFHDLRHKTIYEGIQALASGGIDIDAVTVADELRSRKVLDSVGGMAYIASLPDAVPTASSWEYYARIAQDAHQRRTVIDQASQIINKAYEESDPGKVVEDAEHWLHELSRTRGHGGHVLIDEWQVDRWTASESPKREFLVNGLVMAKKPQMLASEGGAGKTFLMLDLALRVASHRPGDVTNTWCGQPVRKGGTVVMITTEDDKDELHIRLNDIDPGGRMRRTAGENLIIIPTIDTGGGFALAEYGPGGNVRTSKAWKTWLERFRMISETRDLQLVIIDTLASTLHGDENASIVMKEYWNEAVRVCAPKDQGGCGAAIMVSHHVRKLGKTPVRTAEDMKQSIRGSGASVATCRNIIGVWEASNSTKRLKAMGQRPGRKQLWNMAVVKANNPEMLGETLTLMRGQTGLLEDVTDQDTYSERNRGRAMDRRPAWLLEAIRLAAMSGHPYTAGGKNAANGLYARRSELPPEIRNMGWTELDRLKDYCVDEGLLVPCAIKGSKSKQYLDIPDGTIAGDPAGAEVDSGAYTPPEWQRYVYDEDSKTIVKMAPDPASNVRFPTFS